MTPEAAFTWCADEARRLDHDRYLCALFAPASARPALLTLAALDVTLARIADAVSEPMLGRIRLEWWREAVAAIDDPPPDHPIVVALASARRRHGLPAALLARLIEARGADLAADPPPDLAALEDRAEATAGTLTALQLTALGADDDEDSVVAGRHVGVAWAITGVVRATPFLAAAGRVALPRDRLAAAGLAPEDVTGGAGRRALASVVRETAELAWDRLAAARALGPRIAAGALPVLLPAALADLYLGRLRRAGYDPWACTAPIAGPRRQLRLLAKVVRGRF